MNEFDDLVLRCFLTKQDQLFPEPVCETLEEAEAFLEECMAVIVKSADEVWEYFEEEGLDLADINKEELLDAEEVFAVGDGRYLIVQG